MGRCAFVGTKVPRLRRQLGVHYKMVLADSQTGYVGHRSLPNPPLRGMRDVGVTSASDAQEAAPESE